MAINIFGKLGQKKNCQVADLIFIIIIFGTIIPWQNGIKYYDNFIIFLYKWVSEIKSNKFALESNQTISADSMQDLRFLVLSNT